MDKHVVAHANATPTPSSSTADERRAPQGDAQAPIDVTRPEHLLNRELGLLAFQERVFEEARDPQNPLLERLKFIAIVCSNLDEFFMVRVAGLRQQFDAGLVDRSPDGLTPGEQLDAVRKRAQALMLGVQRYLVDVLLPMLDDAGVHICAYDQLSDDQRVAVDRYYNEMVFPVLTPLAFDPGHPFPHISNLSLNLAVLIRDDLNQEHFARIKVPRALPRLIPVPKAATGDASPVAGASASPSAHRFIWLDQLITAHIHTLFPRMEVLAVQPFHLTRDADLVIQELEASDLLASIQQSLHQRRFGSVVRLMVNPSMPAHMLDILIQNLDLDPDDIYTLPGPLAGDSLMSLLSIDRWDLKYAPYTPVLPEEISLEHRDGDIFEAIRRQDVLIHRPYDSFLPMVELLQRAADDPDVLCIKQTLYRVGKDSPIVEALLRARRNGKQVAVLVELKARFDEESNISWAQTLESEGVHVVYGLLGLKTHSKLSLVVRKEHDRIRRYVHMSTGNYNAVTAKLYTDMGFFTCDPFIGDDVSHIFNYLTGYSDKRDYHKLLVAPITMRQRLLALIDREIEHQRAGREGYLVFKMNALVDTPIIHALYRASQAGVTIDLIVRGICCLRPGVPGLSETIRVVSVVGRYLEHSRIFLFRNGGDDAIYLGSADLMPRNLNRRVEVLFPVEAPTLVGYVRDVLLPTCLNDNVKSRHMQPDGTYTRPSPGDAPPLDSQAAFMQMRLDRIAQRPQPQPHHMSTRDA